MGKAVKTCLFGSVDICSGMHGSFWICLYMHIDSRQGLLLWSGSFKPTLHTPGIERVVTAESRTHSLLYYTFLVHHAAEQPPVTQLKVICTSLASVRLLYLCTACCLSWLAGDTSMLPGLQAV